MTGLRLSVSFLIALTSFQLKEAVPTSKTPYTRTCPYNETEWTERSTKLFCQGKEVYHCFLAEDKDFVREGCIERTTILQGFCPIFTDDGYLHWTSCNETGCPNSSYISDQVYKYRVCFGDTDNAIYYASGSSDDEEVPALGLGIGITVGVLILIIAVVIVYNYYLRQKSDETDDIENGINVLRSENILYVIGTLGNSVSTVGKAIVRKHNINHECLKYLDINEESFEFSANTTYFIDGWFGLWNDNPCEKGLVMETFGLIIESAKQSNTKFVIGLRTEDYESYKKYFKENRISFPQRQIILRDSSSKHKETKVDKHLRKMKRECITDKCPCKKLCKRDITSIDLIGCHLVIELLKLDHTMAPHMVSGNEGPLQTMIQHFKTLETRDKNLFECILYIVLVGFYDKNEFRSDVAGNFSISENILKEGTNLEKYTKKLNTQEITQMWTSKLSGNYKETNEIIVFWHTFLYISAFHACYSLFPERMMRYCHLDAILQLVRPEGQTSDFTVEANRELISSFYKERIEGTVFENHVRDHPLLYLHAQS